MRYTPCMNSRSSAISSSAISVPSVRVGVAFGLLFVFTLFAGGLVNYLAGLVVRKTGLSGTDRMLGLAALAILAAGTEYFYR